MKRRAFRNVMVLACMVAVLALLRLGRPGRVEIQAISLERPTVAAEPIRAATKSQSDTPPRPTRDPALARETARDPGHATPGGLPSTVGMVVARDPETGELGVPSADQWRLIREHQAETVRLTPDGFAEIHRADGAVGLDLGGRLQSYSVARVGPDGRPAFRCVSAATDTAAVTDAAPSVLEER